jgi:hypothetical protein
VAQSDDWEKNGMHPLVRSTHRWNSLLSDRSGARFEVFGCKKNYVSVSGGGQR